MVLVFDRVCAGPISSVESSDMLSLRLMMRGISNRLSSWLHDTRNVENFWRISLILIVAIGVLVPMGATHAQGMLMTDALNYLLTFIAYILQWIIIMLGRLVIFFVDLVISVAQYNTFVRAMPVQTGWPIVRDLINMFFIVVLLISAFSTIIGYEKYHYSNIIKKFFLMAVLVNFSLPLFGIAIDFSQVLMLTFVNGFRAAAAGNFVTILKLDQVMTINSNAIDLSPDNGTNPIENPLLQKVTAMMFGVFILGISATILAIMTVYLIARIVGLWLLLITSPGALFVTGLPSSLQGKVPGFGGDWWSRLWSLLVGGPVMAFFLWLTLATAANVGPTFTAAKYAGSGEVQAAQNYFQTAIGNVENFGTYLVAIIMLFSGLSYAVSASNSVAPAAGKFAGKIRDYGVGTTKFLAYGGMAAAGAYGARQVGGAAREVGEGFDRSYGITKGVGSMIQTVGLKTGWVGATKLGTNIAGTRGRAVKKQQERFEEMTKGLSTGKRMDYAKKRMESILSNADEKKGLSELLTKDAFSGEGQKHLLGKYETEGKKLFGDDKQKVDAYKKYRLGEDRKKMLSDYQKAAGENEDKQKWIREKIEATPSHAEKVSDFIAGKMGDDPTYFRKIKAEDFENASVTSALFAAAGGFDANGDLKDKDGMLGKAMQGGDKKAQLLRATKEQIRREAERAGVSMQEFLENKNDSYKNSGFADALFVAAENEPDKHRMVYKSEVAAGGAAAAAAVPAAAAAAGGAVTGTVIRNEEAIAEQQRAIERTRAALARVQELPEGEREAERTRLNGELHQAQNGMLNAGAPAAEVFRMDRDGGFEDPTDRQAFEMSVQNVFQEGKKDYKTYSKVDMSVVNRNPKGRNEARETLVKQANVGELGMSYALADEGSKKNIAEIARAIDMEGGKSQSMIEAHNRRSATSGGVQVDTKEVARAGQLYMQSQSDLGRKKATEALQSALKDSGLAMKIDDAVAMAKRQEVLSDPALQHYTRHASGRLTQAVSRGKEGIANVISEKTAPLRQVITDAGVGEKISSVRESMSSAKDSVSSAASMTARAASNMTESARQMKEDIKTTAAKAMRRATPQERARRDIQRLARQGKDFEGGDDVLNVPKIEPPSGGNKKT